MLTSSSRPDRCRCRHMIAAMYCHSTLLEAATVDPATACAKQLLSPQVATGLAHNAGHNCIKAEVVVTAAEWPLRQQFLDALRHPPTPHARLLASARSANHLHPCPCRRTAADVSIYVLIIFAVRANLCAALSRRQLGKVPARKPWYPQSAERAQAFCEAFPDAEEFGGRDGAMPWRFKADLSPGQVPEAHADLLPVTCSSEHPYDL